MQYMILHIILFWNQEICSIFFFLLKHFQLLLGKENCQVFLQVPLLMAVFVHYHSTDDNNIYYLYINDWKLLGDGRAVKQS